MLPRIAYQHFHQQTNAATLARALLAEFGLDEFDTGRRGEELVLHGLLQRGPYEEHRGLLLRATLRHLFDAGLSSEILHDGRRTAQLQQRITAVSPDFNHRLVDDLGIRGSRPLALDHDFRDDARVILVEARHSTAGLPLHLLLARREDQSYFVMNTDSGQEHAYDVGQMGMHLNSPVGSGAVNFAGRQYLYTGIAVKISVPQNPTSRGARF